MMTSTSQLTVSATPDDSFAFPDPFLGSQAASIAPEMFGAAAAVTPVKPVVAPTALYLQEAGDTSAINVDDIHQGQIGDCFVLSPMGELALFHPSFITNMIHTNANGTETVTLYTGANGKLPTWGTTAFKAVSETVTNSFATNGVNNQAGQDVVGSQKEIWAQVLEQAVGELNGGMGAISNGGSPVIAMEELTGKAATWMAPASLTATGLQALSSAGDLLTFDTSSVSKLPYGLVSNHCYMFEKLTTVAGVAEVQLGNPWGATYNPSLIPLSKLSTAFVEIDVGKIS